MEVVIEEVVDELEKTKEMNSKNHELITYLLIITYITHLLLVP